MKTNLFWLVLTWAILATGVIALAIYRKLISRDEDTIVHIESGGTSQIMKQEATAQRLESIDHWGKILTIAALIYGLVVAAYYLYLVWTEAPVLG